MSPVTSPVKDCVEIAVSGSVERKLVATQAPGDFSPSAIDKVTAATADCAIDRFPDNKG
jgi:hypothetical protein